MSTTRQSAEREDLFSRAEAFYEKHQKAISIAGGALLAIVIIIIGITNFYLPAQEKEAQEQIFKAQLYFEKDSFNLALNGDANYKGFLRIATDYAWTKTGKLAHYYAGVCYLRLGEYDKAIEHLKKFNTSEPVVKAMTLGALGDAYSETGEMEKAIKHYRKAATVARNEFITPYYLFKAALALKASGQKEEARKLFEELKYKYPDSNEGREASRYLAMLQG
ncbi:MAG: hypothetical protein KatS3mg031_2585 [Chitinophagales bacterium]|nr:MAG: hypothetical protein KatS3mg031_2585 [Chitinophagales bacterium]